MYYTMNMSCPQSTFTEKPAKAVQKAEKRFESGIKYGTIKKI